MSVVFVVVPVAVGAGWPILTLAAAAAAGQLGLKALARAQSRATRLEERVELDLQNAQALTDGVRDDDTVRFSDGQVEVTVHKDGRGKVQVHVSGAGKSKAELTRMGQDFMGRMMQQYAYQKVTETLAQKGFQIVEEEADATRAVRIRFRKFE